MNPAYRDHAAPAPSHFTRLNRWMFLVILLALVVAALLTAVPMIKKRREQSATLERLEREIAEARKINEWRTLQEKLLQSDPAYLESMARDRLELKKPEETILRLDVPAADPPAK